MLKAAVLLYLPFELLSLEQDEAFFSELRKLCDVYHFAAEAEELIHLTQNQIAVAFITEKDEQLIPKEVIRKIEAESRVFVYMERPLFLNKAKALKGADTARLIKVSQVTAQLLLGTIKMMKAQFP